MVYHGKLYGKIGNKYFDTGRTSNEMFEMLIKLRLIFDSFAMPTEQNLKDYSKEINELLTKITQ